MADSPSPTKITFLLSGEPQGASRGAAAADMAAGIAAGIAADVQALVPGLGELKQSVRLGARRSGGEALRVEAEPGRDIVILQVANGPALVLHPETARDLLLAQTADRRDPGKALPTEVRIPPELQWQAIQQLAAPAGGAGAGATAASRGFVDKAIVGALGAAGEGLFGKVVVQAVQVITGHLKDRAADFAASAVVKNVDALVDNAVYALKPDGIQKLKTSATRLDAVPAAADGGPLLVLLHGTFTNTFITFHHFWEYHPARVKQLFEHYGNRVYGFDHPTLGESPIENALTLAKALPAGARLHLLTHSRGGLVGEVLARVCAQPDIGAEALALFQAAPEQAQALAELGALVKAKGLRVDRMLRVACPARGTLLASSRMDAYVSVLKWAMELAQLPVAPGDRQLPRRGGPAPQERIDGARPGRPDARQPADHLAACGGRAAARPVARGGRRPGGGFGLLLAEDPAGRLLLLDRQRPRRADQLDVRRRGAQARCELPAGGRRPGLALQLFPQRTERRSHHQRPDRGQPAALPAHRPDVRRRPGLGRLPRRGRRPARREQALHLRAARHPGQQPGGGGISASGSACGSSTA